MDKGLKVFIVLIFFVNLSVYAQENKPDSVSKDSIKVHFIYTKVDTTKATKIAPESLKNLFEEIVRDEVQKAEVQKKKNGLDLEIDGLVIDDTKTKNGREFFDFFFRDWEAPEGAKNFTIYISEKPFRLNSTLIEVSINETLVYQSLLQPRVDVIEGLAIESIATTQMYLANYEALMQELGGSDVRGTGIY